MPVCVVELNSWKPKSVLYLAGGLFIVVPFLKTMLFPGVPLDHWMNGLHVNFIPLGDMREKKMSSRVWLDLRRMLMDVFPLRTNTYP